MNFSQIKELDKNTVDGINEYDKINFIYLENREYSYRKGGV